MAGVSVKFKAVDEISAKFDSMVTAGERALDAFDKMESSADKAYSTVSDGAEQASRAMDKATQATDYWTDAIGNYDKGAMEAIYTTEELVAMGFKTEDALSEVADTADKASEEIEKFGKESKEAAEKSDEFGDKSKEAIVSLEDVLAGAGIAMALHEVADAFAECSDAAAEFEVSMAMVSTIADSSVLSTEQISEQIKQVSRDTAIAVTDLAEATYGAISASIATADAVTFVEQANQLAVGGFTSQATAVDVLTTAINAYGLSADKAGQLSDYLVTTQNLGKTTVDQLASSIGMVIPSAAAFNVEMDNLSTAYAILTANGVQTAQSTTYLKAMFTELASTESEVAKVLKEETGQSFAELMEQGYSLGDVMQILGDSVDGNTTAFMNMWGSMEAGSGAVSLYNSGAEKYAHVLDQMRNSAGATALAYEKMTNTTEFGSQRMENSFNNLKIAIGDDLNPTVATFQNTISGMVDGFAGFIEKHPAITALLTGITVGIAAITIGITGYAAATKIAALAQTAWNAVMNMNPVFLAITAVTALTAAVITFATVLGDSVDEYDTWTDSTRKQYDELQSLEQEYENAVEVYGETSEEASRLKYQIDELSESFANNKQTLEEFYAECDALIESSKQMVEEYEESNRTLHSNELRTLALIQRLEDLAESTDTSASKQMEMEAIIAELNETVDGLNLSYEDLVENQEVALSSLRAYAEAQAKEERMQAQYQAYVDAIGMEAELREKLAEATDENTAAQERYNAASAEYFDYVASVTRYDSSGMAGLGLVFSGQYKDLVAAEDAYHETQARVDELTEQLDEQLRIQEECEEAWGSMAESASDGVDSQIESSVAVAEAVAGVQTQLEELAVAYDTAYTAAYDSISGQMGLFESMKTETEQSVADMQAALDSQAEYLNLYTENLQKAADYGLNESLIASLSDGSAESAGQLDAIITKIEELGGTTESMSEDAKSFVDSFNASFSQVEDAKETWATSVAKMETDFDTAMTEIEGDMEDAVNNMNMADEARANAIATMNAYIEGIKSKTAEVNSAIDAITWANSNMSSFEPNGYAVGTSSAEPGLALVGEEGPELVDFGGGERVYTADETADMLSGGRNDDFYVAPASTEETSEVGGDKTITLKLEGAGEMKVGGGGMSKEAVLEVLIENVKDVLMGIIQQEILEEGDLSYEF